MSADYIPSYGSASMYEETDGMLSLYPGNGNTANGQDIYINVLDIIVWLNANGSTPDSSNWNIRADYNADGVVNTLDAYKWIHGNGVTGSARIGPLAVAITWPADGYTTNEAFCTISGTVTDNNTTVEINGNPASVAGGTFAAHDIPLPVIGDNMITAVATDLGGNMAQHHIIINRAQ